MGKGTSIEWTGTPRADGTMAPGNTFSPWWGCVAASPACDFCYAESLANRWGHHVWGVDAPRRFFGEKHWAEPLKWNRQAKAEGIATKVFCASMCDVFEHLPGETGALLDKERARLWALIEATPNLTWLLLTKRPKNILRMVPAAWRTQWPQHVWAGTTAENQEWLDKRMTALRLVPAPVRFLSIEPMLGLMDLSAYIKPTLVCVSCRWEGELSEKVPDPKGFHFGADQCPSCKGEGNMLTLWGDKQLALWRDGLRDPDAVDGDGPCVNWIIGGGESGSQARPPHPDWARSLRDQCVEAGVSFFWKQWGEWSPDAEGKRAVAPDGSNVTGHATTPGDGLVRISRLGKKGSGRLLDGRTWDEMPEARP